MTTALSTISVLPSGKEQVAKFTRMLKDEILAGDKKPLPILVQMKYIQKTIDDVLKDVEIKRCMVREFELYGKEKVIEIDGAKLNEQEVGVKYAYSECGDPQWNDLEKQIAGLTEKKKEREKFLQNIPYDKGTVDSDSGLFITRAPKKSETQIIVKFF